MQTKDDEGYYNQQKEMSGDDVQIGIIEEQSSSDDSERGSEDAEMPEVRETSSQYVSSLAEPSFAKYREDSAGQTTNLQIAGAGDTSDLV
jgi:hypothetical protein